MRTFTASKRVAACGRPGAREDGSVVFRVTESGEAPGPRRVGLEGVFHCASVWLCAVCSAQIAVKRAAELENVLAHYLAAGGWAVLVTLTMRHHRGHGLAQCMRGAAAGWDAVNSGGAWQRHKTMADYAGYCRALEVTESPENGWHVHHHAVLVFNSRPSAAVLDVVAGGMFARWSAALVRAGLPAPSEEVGIDVQHLDESGGRPDGEQAAAWARYVAKGLAGEAVLGGTKRARGGNRSIRELMEDALIPLRFEDPETGEIVETVDETARDRLAEYERVMRGRRQLTWSEGRHDLRAGAGLGEDASDEALLAETIEGEGTVVDKTGYHVIEPEVTDAFAVAQRGGTVALREWLTERGVRWVPDAGLDVRARAGRVRTQQQNDDNGSAQTWRRRGSSGGRGSGPRSKRPGGVSRPGTTTPGIST